MERMIHLPFKDYLYEKFLEWEKLQPKRRSSLSAFARWLSDNSFDVEIKQQVLDSWVNGVIPKDEKYVVVLAEKIGDEIYELLDRKRPNPYLQIVNRVFEHLPVGAPFIDIVYSSKGPSAPVEDQRKSPSGDGLFLIVLFHSGICLHCPKVS